MYPYTVVCHTSFTKNIDSYACECNHHGGVTVLKSTLSTACSSLQGHPLLHSHYPSPHPIHSNTHFPSHPIPFHSSWHTPSSLSLLTAPVPAHTSLALWSTANWGIYITETELNLVLLFYIMWVLPDLNYHHIWFIAVDEYFGWPLRIWGKGVWFQREHITV